MAGCSDNGSVTSVAPSTSAASPTQPGGTGPTVAPKPNGSIDVVYDTANIKNDYSSGGKLKGFFVSSGFAYFHAADRNCLQVQSDSIYCQDEYALNLKSHKTDTLFSTSGDVIEGAAYSGDKVFLLVKHDPLGEDSSTDIIAINNQNGEEAWRHEVRAGRSLAFSNDTLFCFDDSQGPGAGGSFAAIDPETGREKWSLNHGGVIDDDAVAGGTAFIAGNVSSSYNGPSAIDAVDLSSGTMKWKFSNGGFIGGYAVAGGMVFTAGTDPAPAAGTGAAKRAVVHGIDAATGQDRWVYTPDEGQPPAVTQPPGQEETQKLRLVGATPATVVVERSVEHGGVRDDLFIGTVDETLYGIDVNTGKPRWTTEIVTGTTDRNAVSYILEDGTVYTLKNNRPIDWSRDTTCIETGEDCPAHFTIQLETSAIDADSGAEAWNVTTNELQSQQPDELFLLAVAGGVIYMTDMPHQPGMKLGDSDIGFVYRLR